MRVVALERGGLCMRAGGRCRPSGLETRLWLEQCMARARPRPGTLYMVKGVPTIWSKARRLYGQRRADCVVKGVPTVWSKALYVVKGVWSKARRHACATRRPLELDSE